MVKIRSARNQKPSAAERERKMEREREREREGGREPLFDYPLARCNNEFIKMLGRMRAQSADPSPSTSKMVLEGLARNNLHLHAYIYVYTNRRIILLRIILHFFFFFISSIRLIIFMLGRVYIIRVSDLSRL